VSLLVCTACSFYQCIKRMPEFGRLCEKLEEVKVTEDVFGTDRYGRGCSFPSGITVASAPIVAAAFRGH
jgi:hypothetical protein